MVIDSSSFRFRRLLFCTFIDCLAMMMMVFIFLCLVHFLYLVYFTIHFIYERVFYFRYVVGSCGVDSLLTVVALLSADFSKNGFLILDFIFCFVRSWWWR